MLKVPLLTELSSLEVTGDSVTGRRQTDNGIVRLRASLPAVVSLTDELPEAELPTLRGVLGAKRKPLDVWSLADLGLTAPTSRTEVRHAEQRPRRSAGPRITDDGSAAAQIADFLVEHRLI